MPSVLAIDAAWTISEPSGVALLRQDDDLSWECVALAPSYAAFHRLAQGDEVDWSTNRFEGDTPNPRTLINSAQRILGEDRPSIVTIDMPVATVQVIGRRAADDAISREFGGRKCAAHSPSPERPGTIGENLTLDFGSVGYEVATTRTTCGSWNRLVEVYPHPALLALLNVESRFAYKVSKSIKFWPNTGLDERIAKLLDAFCSIRNALEQEIKGIDLQLPETASTLAGLKRYEDALDALVCGWVGIRYINRQARAAGDDTAAIWLPTNGDAISESRPSTFGTTTVRRSRRGRGIANCAAERTTPVAERSQRIPKRNVEDVDSSDGCLCCQQGVPVRGPRICPLCGHVFKGNGWDGIEAHWRAKHEDVAPYAQFWASLCSQHSSNRRKR